MITSMVLFQVFSCIQVAQLSLMNPRDALHHCKRNILKQSRDHNHVYLGSDISSFWWH